MVRGPLLLPCNQTAAVQSLVTALVIRNKLDGNTLMLCQKSPAVQRKYRFALKTANFCLVNKTLQRREDRCDVSLSGGGPLTGGSP